MDKIDEINTFDRRTIIMVSHNAAHLSYAHRVYYLKDGYIVREVVNPQRKQIKPVREGETIVTELEQLARLFPYDSIDTLRVKSMVNFLTQALTFDQLVRLEHAVALFIKGKVDREAFVKALTVPYERGGVEINEREASRMAKLAETMLHQADDIRRFRAKKDNAGVFFSQHKLAERLRDHLLHLYRLKLTKEQDDHLIEMIADRVTGVAEDEQFNARLEQTVKNGGLGLSSAEADELTRYFEKIIAQGVDVSYKN
jgi:hypothetical protein